MMRNKFALVAAFVALLILLWVTGGVVAGPPAEGPGGDVSIAATVSSKISYQGVLKENGNPVTGSRNMTFRLYSDNTCTTQVGSDIVKSGVQVTNGLFSVELDVNQANFNGQGLWLKVFVGGTGLGCQEILPVPYALSLRPGAYVRGTLEDSPALYVHNDGSGITAVGLWAYSVNAAGVYGESNYGIGLSGVGHDDSVGTQGYNTGRNIGVKGYSASGHGVYAESGGTGLTGAALYAKSMTAGGIALRAHNDSGASTDATLVVSNDGTGPLIKGFGGDGGEDEFRISNNGTFETKADSYIFVPGTEAAVDTASATTTELQHYFSGYVVVDPSTTGTKYIQFGVVLPSVLYGQPVKVEEVTIFYRTSNPASYIDRTIVFRQKATGRPDFYDYPDWYTLVDDDTNRNADLYTSYSVTPTADNTLSANEGFISVRLHLYFANANHSITIGGVRLRLGHHHLY